MRYLSWLLKLALFGLVVVFLAKNTDPVTVRYYLGGEWRAPLFLVLSIAFLAGIVLGIVAGLAQLLRLRRQVATLKRQLPPPAARAEVPARAAGTR
jgi:uncharacterized integral membrane protein